MEKSSNTSPQQTSDIPTSTKEIARVILVGAGVGALVALFAEVIRRFFIEPVFCRSADSLSVCSNGDAVAFNSALVIFSIIAVAVLVKLNVFRPLLVALGAAISLWGINGYLKGLSVLEYSFWIVVLFVLAYVLFFWLMRARNFLISLAALVITVILIRLVLAI